MLLDLLYEAIDKYIPRISLTNNKFSRKTTLNRSTKSKMLQKHRPWKLCLQANDTNVYTNIVKLVNKYVFLRDSPSKILKKIFVIMLKIILKNFWKYVNNKRKTNVSIPQLYKPNTNKKIYWEADFDKAEALGSPFSNVFTIEGENTWNIAEKTLPDSKLAISFDAATILKNLNGLDIIKSPGPDFVKAKILKEL